MEPPEVLALVVVLLLALYGCTCAVKQLMLLYLKPRREHFCVVLPLDASVEGVEHHVRHAKHLALHYGWRLFVADHGMTKEQREIVDRLLRDGIGEYVADDKILR